MPFITALKVNQLDENAIISVLSPDKLYSVYKMEGNFVGIKNVFDFDNPKVLPVVLDKKDCQRFLYKPKQVSSEDLNNFVIPAFSYVGQYSKHARIIVVDYMSGYLPINTSILEMQSHVSKIIINNATEQWDILEVIDTDVKKSFQKDEVMEGLYGLVR